MRTLVRTALLGGLCAVAWLPAQAEESTGVITRVQGSVVHIDNTYYRTTLQTRQGETLSDQSEAFWDETPRFEVGDEVVFDTRSPDGAELDYLLRRIK
ncbi:MAG: hypothetical protein GYB41_04805 [Oceanospirillales bacterium]|uniref:DUF5666 domain-containing protein n=1 Tax=Marinobacterium halophilum TaxID=267374 RepID=A0A2P8F2B5_9GAMM|nr:hypothetical protein [Marinobacterium halophilum]MBR9827948.1 hypothetical protein [Oceanospirillales bacterium]PSL15846.1 hypothetical protein CLV44_103127 [Marinobacterium halophilum]